MSRLSQLALNEEGFAFDPGTGDSFMLNDVALFIVRALGRLDDDPAIVKALVTTYDVTPDDAVADLADFRARLRTLGLL